MDGYESACIYSQAIMQEERQHHLTLQKVRRRVKEVASDMLLTCRYLDLPYSDYL